METNNNSTPDSTITKKVKKNNTARDILVLIIVYLLLTYFITLKVKNIRLFILFLVLASVAFILAVSYIFITNNNLFSNIIFIKSNSKESKKILENIDKDKKSLNEEAKRNLDLTKQLEELNQYLSNNNKALKLYNENTNKLNDINKLLTNSLVSNATKTKSIVKANRKASSIAADLINRIKNILKIKSKANHRFGSQEKGRTEIVKENSLKRFLDKLSKFLGIGKGVSVARGRGLCSGGSDSKAQQQSAEVGATNTQQQDNKTLSKFDNASPSAQTPAQQTQTVKSAPAKQQDGAQRQLQPEANPASPARETPTKETNPERDIQTQMHNQTQKPQQEQKSELDINAQELKHLAKGEVVDLNNDGTVAGMPIETAMQVAELVRGVKETEQGLESLGIDSGNIKEKLQGVDIKPVEKPEEEMSIEDMFNMDLLEESDSISLRETERTQDLNEAARNELVEIATKNQKVGLANKKNSQSRGLPNF